MVADPLTKGKTLKHVLNTVLHNGERVVQHEVKKWSHTISPTVALFVQAWLNPSAQTPVDNPLGLRSRLRTPSVLLNPTGPCP
eukprot:3883069-Prorocentrum_lima.AAC.1